jgi:hypothetical protein
MYIEKRLFKLFLSDINFKISIDKLHENSKIIFISLKNLDSKILFSE